MRATCDTGHTGEASSETGWRKLGALLPVMWLVACVATNPAYDPAGIAGDGSTSSSTGPAAGDETRSSSTTTGQDDPGAAVGDSDPGELPTSGGTSTGWDAATSSGDVSDTDAGAEAGVQLEPQDLGQSCGESNGCGDLGPGAECCDAAQCEGTCMVACEDESQCPFDGMGCEHGYCLFPCGDELDDNRDDDRDDRDDRGDADCSDWPGFTCQHGMRFCEND